MRKYLTTLILIALGFGAGLIAQGQVQILLAQPADRAVDSPSGETYAPNQLPAADLVFQRVPGPDVPSLQELTAGSTTDAEAMAKVVAYYHDNQERLRALWREDNDTRLAGIFTMYVVHISTPYGETTYRFVFPRILAAAPRPLWYLLDHAGAHRRRFGVDVAHVRTHQRLAWLDRDQRSMGNGKCSTRPPISGLTGRGWNCCKVSRVSTALFTHPCLTSNRPDARLHMSEGYNMEQFRVDLRGLGLYYNPPGEPFLSDRPHSWDATLPL